MTTFEVNKNSPSLVSLLKRYLQMYWLKPMAAATDAANAWCLRQYAWNQPILEIGCGDGVFSFIMHDGEFGFVNDRYDQASPTKKGDMFDVYSPRNAMPIQKKAWLTYDYGVDFRQIHAKKCTETGLYKEIALAEPELLPFKSSYFKTVFLYFPHGASKGSLDYSKILPEIHRVLVPDGVVLVNGLNDIVANHFVCYPLHQFFKRVHIMWLSKYFERLDGGRYEEITGLGHSLSEWRHLLKNAGFQMEEEWSMVRPSWWALYDFQTRPIERYLAAGSIILNKIKLKAMVKVPVVYSLLLLFILLYPLIKPKRITDSTQAERDIFFLFKATASN